MCLGRGPAMYLPIGKLKVGLASQIDTHLHPIWRGWDLAENGQSIRRKICGE